MFRILFVGKEGRVLIRDDKLNYYGRENASGSYLEISPIEIKEHDPNKAFIPKSYRNKEFETLKEAVSYANKITEKLENPGLVELLELKFQ